MSSVVRDRLGRFAFGADYNPEQWPEQVQDEDVALMRAAGVSLVSVGIFSWAVAEPEPGRYQLDWLDRVLDRLAANGIGACLATMTASPPPWLAHRHPETLPRRADGTLLSPGARQHYCPSSPVYRAYAAGLVETLATRYAGHPALAMWHVNNEYGCHVPECFCEVSAAAFRGWLAERYGGVDGLNEAWSTTFWSQRYHELTEVRPPRTAPTFPNPAQVLDYKRFSSHALLECFLLEKEILRRVTPGVPVTTNFVGAWHRIDVASWAPHLDVVSYDSYPDPHDPDTVVQAAFAYDQMRALHGKPWLLLEQAPSAVNWRTRNAPKAPGQMRLWSYQAVARGADAVMYFQWRQSRGGAERFHSAMVPHAGPGARAYRETAALGAELAGLEPLLGSETEASVALLADWSSGWAVQGSALPSADLSFEDTNLAHYRPLWTAGIAVDVVSAQADLSRFRLLVVPNLYLVDEPVAARLVEYVRAGGHLVLSFFSGIVDSADRVHLGGYPGPFRELLGLTVEEFWPLPADGVIALESGGTGRIWSEWITPAGAEVLDRFAEGELAGLPAITRHAFGAGVATYLGTRPDEAGMAEVLGRALADAGVEPVLAGLPAGVEVAERRGDQRWLFLLNHNTSEVTVPVPAGAVDALTDKPLAAAERLAGRGVLVARLPLT
ncbi:beta-galactosidase [Crossiella sp. SN42]|uniref:beta-galactosidase n=1 Tax=Crossiella sp. SN42 TaxID=2944808 RepID=UPI00207D0C8E|nr:beta-galactosidase [Crossiella sp. SN42]MCO1575804.1 beta-galactosidase [Crossiella sp. SN42]